MRYTRSITGYTSISPAYRVKAVSIRCCHTIGACQHICDALSLTLLPSARSAAPFCLLCCSLPFCLRRCSGTTTSSMPTEGCSSGRAGEEEHDNEQTDLATVSNPLVEVAASAHLAMASTFVKAAWKMSLYSAARVQIVLQ